ncbi:MAG TPA: bifunctional diguanylate cyclase/phosphodiesterase [Solirubrobacteraceae bacterium]|nr:bifunctional diguanylate cyclase/phosphodiesterase [Solirubrobacteraceae bacterium]
MIVGVAASVLLADRWRASVLRSNKAAFHSTATDLGRTLSAKLDSNSALLRATRAIATIDPNAGETRLTAWYRQYSRGATGSPGAAAELIEPVPASRLAAFGRTVEGEPAFRALLTGPFKITPAGVRSRYCLARAIVGPAGIGSNLYPPLLDYCAPTLPGIGRSPFATLFNSAATTGTTIVTAIPGFALTAVGAAVYRLGTPLVTAPERRRALTGVVGVSFNSDTLIRSLLVGHDSLALTLYHRNVGGPLTLVGRADARAGGGAPSPSYSQRRDLGEGWLLATSGTADHAAWADGQGLIALLIGLLITLLLLLVYRVLSVSRRRAWGLVGEKTGELAYRALHDPLTDLPNRSLVLDRAGQVLARARLLGVTVTALFVDIDGFKQINDRFGHQAGDEILRQVGARLKTVLRDNDTVGRLGGDEFVMVIDSIGVNALPELVAERILDVLRQPFELPAPATAPAILTASIGIATGLPANAEALLLDADLALFKAKAIGKNGYALFESAMQTDAQHRMRLELDLADALEAKQFSLVYQPMLDLHSERVVGVEALLRWNHPSAGLVRPDVFIPIAEENGLIIPLGQWVLEQACAQGAAWRAKGHALNISVNASARQLERPEFVDEVGATLAQTGLDAKALTLEITETVLMRKPDATAQLLARLKTLGVRIAVDDFGTGYSSLAYLRQFPVDSLKIDRTFITGLTRSSEALALAHTLIQLGKALGLQTLAEGVEESEQVRELQREGCDLAQGFLFARPMAPDALEAFLDERRAPLVEVSAAAPG